MPFETVVHVARHVANGGETGWQIVAVDATRGFTQSTEVRLVGSCKAATTFRNVLAPSLHAAAVNEEGVMLDGFVEGARVDVVVTYVGDLP